MSSSIQWNIVWSSLTGFEHTVHYYIKMGQNSVNKDTYFLHLNHLFCGPPFLIHVFGIVNHSHVYKNLVLSLLRCLFRLAQAKSKSCLISYIDFLRSWANVSLWSPHLAFCIAEQGVLTSNIIGNSNFKRLAKREYLK